MPSRIKDVDEFLRLSREEYADDLSRDAIDREEARFIHAFTNSTDTSLGQWEETALKGRKAEMRPIIQANKLPVYVAHVGNAGRQNKPAIKISTGDKGLPETSEMLQSRIREIEYDCDADIAYDTARDQQVSSGRAALRVTTEIIPGKFYPNGEPRQRQIIERIEDQFSVVWGPGRKYDRSDCDRVWVVTLITKDEHIRRFGKESVLNKTDFARNDDNAQWVGVGKNSEMMQIAEKFQKHYTTETEYEVCRYVMDGAQILQEADAITADFDIVPMWGREAFVDGVQRRYALTCNSIHWQRLANLYLSNIAEKLAMDPKTPYEAPIGSIPANIIEDWANAGVMPKGVLFYNQYEPGGSGRPLDKPSRNVVEPAIQALSLGYQQCVEGIKASMGIFDASIGQRSNETSGIAQRERKKEGDITNFHFADNEARTRKRVGQILLKRISLIDKPGTSITIRHEDGKKTEQVPIGTEYRHKTGKMITHVLTDGDYGVTVSSELSYGAAREEMHEKDAAMITAAPELLFVIGDELMRTDDYPGAEARADRMERYINMKTPGLIPPKDNAQPVPPEVQQKLVAMGQELQKTHAFAQSLHEQLQTKMPEIQSKERMQSEELAFKREQLAEQSRVELARLGIGADIARLELEIEALKHQAGLEAGAQGDAAQRAHEAAAQGADRDAARESQESSQTHAADLQQGAQDHAAQQSDAEREAADQA